MAITKTLIDQGVSGNRRFVVYDITFDGNYQTGGLSLTPTDLGLSVVTSLVTSSPGGKTAEYDQTNRKLKLHSGGSEVANASNQASVTTRVRAEGF